MNKQVNCKICNTIAPDIYIIGSEYYCFEHYGKEKEKLVNEQKKEKSFYGLKLKKFTGD